MPASPTSARTPLAPEPARSSTPAIASSSRTRPRSMCESLPDPGVHDQGGPRGDRSGPDVASAASIHSRRTQMTTVEDQRPIDGDKLNAFVFRAVDEVGATLNTALVVMGDRLGLYRAMAGAGPLSPGQVAER